MTPKYTEPGSNSGLRAFFDKPQEVGRAKPLYIIVPKAIAGDEDDVGAGVVLRAVGLRPGSLAKQR